jgi:hypothetical protein
VADLAPAEAQHREAGELGLGVAGAVALARDPVAVERKPSTSIASRSPR